MLLLIIIISSIIICRIYYLIYFYFFIIYISIHFIILIFLGVASTDYTLQACEVHNGFDENGIISQIGALASQFS